ncbi:MAG: hypothetical protein IPJ76_18565 [Flavobacteriales bacterium]|nr:MAG: hypothetical protein IPJ76_18565 [Flavobacteriales bacterium]
MKRFGLLWWVFVLASTPLLFGSIVFFYWYYSREWFARAAHIEAAAVLTIVLYGLLAFVALCLLLHHCVHVRRKWGGVMLPPFILVTTWVVFDLYSTTYFALRERAYVRVIGRETGSTHMAIWSAHIEQPLDVEHDDQEFMLSYVPSYTHDWGGTSSLAPYYAVDSVFIEVREDGRTRCWLMPFLEKGDCRTLTMSEIMGFPEAPSREARYGGPVLGY